MASSVLLPLIGRHLAALTITPLNMNDSTGALSSATSSVVSATRLRTNIVINITPVDEEINDDGSPWANHVTTHDDWNCSIDLLPLRSSATPFPMAALITSFEHFMVEFSFTAGGTTYPIKLKGKRSDLGINSGGRGAFKESLNLKSIDCGTGADASMVIG